MKNILGTILIFVAVLSLAFTGTAFLLDKNAGAQSPLSEDINTSQNLIAQKINLELNRLEQLKAKLKGNIFQNPVFKSLKDFSQPLPVEEKGRANPFAPIGQ